MDKIKHIILVLSGKGGVGKSTVASQLALSFFKEGYRVGILDVDLCGPSIPRILGVENQSVHNSSLGWVPVYPIPGNTDLAVMSIGFLIGDKTSPVVWRGPKKTSMISQFMEDVLWGELDFLIIDTPPGTSDEHISIVQKLVQFNLDGAVMVTTPQLVSVADVTKEISFCNQVNVPLIGLIENMSGYMCPHCDECTHIFGRGGGESLASRVGLNFIGRIPIDPKLASCLDDGLNFFEAHENSSSLNCLRDFARNYLKEEPAQNK